MTQIKKSEKELEISERELEIVKELYKGSRTHTEIAVCVQRERKIFKIGSTEISDCLKDVERIILNFCRWRVQNELEATTTKKKLEGAK
jgi:hypothetical protein